MLPTGLVIHVLILVCLYSILAIGLNIIMGCAALFSIAHHALFGIGAYTSALLALAGFPFWLAMLGGMLMAGLISFLIGLPTLGLVGDYLAVATMAMGEIIFAVFRNWDSVTGGQNGLLHIPEAGLLGFSFDSPVRFLGLSAAILLAAYLVADRLTHSPFGRVLKGIREDETATQTLGKDTFWFKMRAFVVGGAFAGAAGSLYAHYIGYIEPSSFALWITFFVWVIVIFGGLGNALGTIAASFVFVVVRESLRFLSLPGNVAAAIQQGFFGIVLIIMTIYTPRGLIPERKYVTKHRGDIKD